MMTQAPAMRRPLALATVGALLAALFVTLSLAGPAQAGQPSNPIPSDPSLQVHALSGRIAPGGTLIVTVGNTAVTNDPNSPFNRDLDLWLCPTEELLPADTAADGSPPVPEGCLGFFEVNAPAGGWLPGMEVPFNLRSGEEPAGAPDNDIYLSEAQWEEGCDFFAVVHFLQTDEWTNWLAADCSTESAAPVPPTLICTPDPVAPGARVTCEITGADPSIDILWAASFDGVFGSAGVRTDVEGQGTFSFLAPRAAAGQSVSVELVEWTRPISVQVTGTAVPARIPAGEGRAPLMVGTLGLLLLGGAVLATRRMITS